MLPARPPCHILGPQNSESNKLNHIIYCYQREDSKHCYVNLQVICTCQRDVSLLCVPSTSCNDFPFRYFLLSNHKFASVYLGFKWSKLIWLKQCAKNISYLVVSCFFFLLAPRDYHQLLTFLLLLFSFHLSSDTRSLVCLTSVTRQSWSAIWAQVVGSVCSIYQTLGSCTEASAVAMDTSRRERSATVERRRWEHYLHSLASLEVFSLSLQFSLYLVL